MREFVVRWRDCYGNMKHDEILARTPREAREISEDNHPNGWGFEVLNNGALICYTV